MVPEPIPACASLMRAALRPGAERRPEELHALDRGAWPVHAGGEYTPPATAGSSQLRGKSALALLRLSDSGHHDPNVIHRRTPQAPRHHGQGRSAPVRVSLVKV